MRKSLKVFFAALAAVLIAGYIIPERKAMPCGTPADYNQNSFWHWPWTRGVNGHPHTGVDIFGKVGTPVVSQTEGLVIYAKNMPGKAGNSVFVLGPKWRIHEYLHLHTVDCTVMDFVKPGELIGTLGKSGNAASTPAHVHYGIVTPIPYVWRAFGTAGTCNPPKRFNWRLMFWLDPADHLPTR
ncbi:MAG: M23 family metallopeptidase [Bacteroidales bacterium]|nr:M23 family metallopeptidase [Bacteroidales bacterium]